MKPRVLIPFSHCALCGQPILADQQTSSTVADQQTSPKDECCRSYTRDTSVIIVFSKLESTDDGGGGRCMHDLFVSALMVLSS